MRPTITRCSLAVQLVDAATGLEPRLAAVQASIDGLPAKPLRKNAGLFVFTDLTYPEFTLRVSSPIYMEQALQVNLQLLDPLYPLVIITLLPSPAYPLPPGTTALAARVVGPEGIPLANAAVTAAILDERAARGRLVQAAMPGGEELEIAQAPRRLSPGEVLLIRERHAAGGVRAVIAEWNAAGKVYRLAQPLAAECPRNSLLMPVGEAHTGEDGRFIIPLRPVLPAKFTVALTIAFDGQEAASQLVELESGTIHTLPDLMLQSFPS